MYSQFKNSKIVRLIFAASLICGLIILINWVLSQQKDVEINWYFLPFIYLAAFFVYFIFAFRWKNNLSVIKSYVSYWKLLKMEILGMLAKWITPFQLNIPLRAMILKEENVSVNNSVALSFFELLLEVSVAMTISGLVGAFWYKELLFFLIPPFFLVVVFIGLPRIAVRKLRNRSTKTNKNFLKKILKGICKAIIVSHKYKNNYAKLLVAIALILILYLLRTIRIILILYALGFAVPGLYIYFTLCILSVAIVISRVPMGLGVAELTGVALFSKYLKREDALLVFLIDRFVVLSLMFVLAFITLLITNKFKKENYD